MSDDLLARPQPFYSQDRVEHRLREEIERLRAEVAEYRRLAAATYQAAGAHDWPVVWLDALSNAATGRAFSTSELLPMETPDHLARAEKAESALAALRKRVEELDPDRWQLVPKEPTAGMEYEGVIGWHKNPAQDRQGTFANAVGCYRAMIAAAPTPYD